mmetsp:Transcript_8677/g.10887  ORF Transcript_8677/g.10887 Transcript_8677/m.10887 type:complete len:194 (-) Transcript_8677:19-600(-)
MTGPTASKPNNSKNDDVHQNRRRADTEPKSPLKKGDVRKSPQAKSRTPLISLRDIAVESNPNATVKKSSSSDDDDDVDFKAIEIKSTNDDEYVTIFQEERGDEENKVEKDKSKSSNSSLSLKVDKQCGNRDVMDIKPRNVIDTFPWKISKESIIQKVKNKVKDVENNVQNVKTNVQEIVEKAHSIQKMAHQVN